MALSYEEFWRACEQCLLPWGLHLEECDNPKCEEYGSKHCHQDQIRTNLSPRLLVP